MKSLKGNKTASDGLTLELEEIPVPDLKPDEILVKVKACAIDLQNEKHFQQILTPNLKSFPIGRDVSGEIVLVGTNVELYTPGMAVTGVLPLDSPYSGCAEMCVLNQFDVVAKPPTVSHVTAAAVVGTGLAAYTAVHYLGHVTAGDTVMVIEGASPQGSLTIQAAQNWGAKVISTYKTPAEKQFLEGFKQPIAQLVELTQRTNVLASSVMEETGGVGVDCIVDCGVRQFTSEEDKDLMGERAKRSVPHKHDILSCLGFSGKWITSQHNLQLDPPDSQQLFLRSGTLAFLFPPAWTLMRAQHGRYQHILKDLIDRVEAGDLKCNEIVSVPLAQSSSELQQKNEEITKSFVIIP